MPRGGWVGDSMPNQPPPPGEKAPEKKEPVPRPAPAQPPKTQTWGGPPRYPVTVPFRPPLPRPAPASDMSLPIQIGILALLAVFLFMSLRSG